MQSINRINQLPEELAQKIWGNVFDQCIKEVRGGCIAWHIECMGVCSDEIPSHLTHLFYDESVYTHQEEVAFQDAMQEMREDWHFASGMDEFEDFDDDYY